MDSDKERQAEFAVIGFKLIFDRSHDREGQF
jgi:hypothetical protein